MKIAMFTDAYFPRINGVTVSVHSFAEGLCKLGHEVCVVCLEYTEEQQKSSFFDEKSNDEKSPFKILRIPSAAIAFSKEDRMMRLDKWHLVKKSMDEFQPDVIHINSEWTVGYFGAIYCRHRHVPFVFTFHTLWEDYLANYVSFMPASGLKKIGMEVVRFYLKRADVIIAPTKRIAEVVERYGIKRKANILPTGIPDSKLEYSEKKSKAVYATLFKKFPELKGKKILLFVGRIVKEKNLPFLFDVLEKVQKSQPDTALLFVGGGPYLNELKESAKSRGLEKSVFFTGYIDGNDLIYFYKLACVFTFPSKTETQGLVTVEAMLSALPVVAIGEMGTVDVMQGDNGGFMVKDDVEEFSNKTLKLLQNASLHKEKSEQALKWGNKWKISSLTPKLLECYQKAIDICKKRESK
ncbi:MULTISPECIES: glycosyltransferase [unclassified Treponema]|uniref:glycosyltransferase n=1 Tax=unclassified Treponema TaxID=2638727 RepID=UPI0025E8872F|nr:MULTISPECIES: glycosyltransferase [unclassified Treponema]